MVTCESEIMSLAYNLPAVSCFIKILFSATSSGNTKLTCLRLRITSVTSSRTPGMDENSWKIPLHHKIKKNNGKMILKEILSDYIPKKFIKGGKAGFAIPIDDLLRTKLKIWAEDIFQSSTLINDHLNYANVKVLWERHKKEQINAGGILWSILVLQNWLINYQK